MHFVLVCQLRLLKNWPLSLVGTSFSPFIIVNQASKQCKTRSLNVGNIDQARERGQILWKSIYLPFETKLFDKLSEAHPDLPVHILESEYGNLFADPVSPPHSMPPAATVGRVLTSIIAVACLRAQTGAGPQLLSHVYGLRKAFDDGTYKQDAPEDIQGGQWLAGDDGGIWLLQTVDRIVEAVSQGAGTSFAPGVKAKI